MWVVLVAVDVAFECRRMWNCVCVSGLIRAVSTMAVELGLGTASASVLVSGATLWVK